MSVSSDTTVDVSIPLLNVGKRMLRKQKWATNILHAQIQKGEQGGNETEIKTAVCVEGQAYRVDCTAIGRFHSLQGIE